ncbi:MAG: IS21-like element helper ATPase IstB [Gemmatimonadota bacterium]
MLTEPTREKLLSLKLGGMAHAWETQQKDPEIAELAFEERFGLLVDAEWLERQNKRLARALREAKFRIADACVENIVASSGRGLEKKRIRELATCCWVELHHNIAVTGAAGVGKTYVACALAQQACRRGYRALYRRAPRLADELRLARADGTYPRLLARIARIDVLIIDDWGLVPLDDMERRDLLEIVEDRYGQRSTILASQLPVDQWHDQIGDPAVADAICDRLLHNAHRIELRGESRRKRKSNEG